jgi:hypothetical protein
MFRVLTSSTRLARCRVGGVTAGVARSVQWSNNTRHFSDLSKYGNVLGMCDLPDFLLLCGMVYVWCGVVWYGVE